jgi:hypothetical protein
MENLSPSPECRHKDPMRRFLAFLAPLALLSCSNEEKIAKDDPLRTSAGFCAEFARRACNADVVERCSAASEEACESGQAEFCEGLIPSGKYSSLTAEECLEAVGKAYEDTELTPEERVLVRTLGGECDKIISGSVGEGGSCTETSDCDRDEELECVVKAGMSEGTCQIPTVVLGGDDCTGDDAVCAAGYYCDQEHCISGGKAGRDCSLAEPCGTGFRCLTAAGTPPGASADGGVEAATCQALAGVGEDCDGDDACTTGICTPVLDGTGVCASLVILAPSDPTCRELR